MIKIFFCEAARLNSQMPIVLGVISHWKRVTFMIPQKIKIDSWHATCAKRKLWLCELAWCFSCILKKLPHRKNSKNSDSPKTCCNYGIDPKFSDRYAWANIADPDQTTQGLHWHCLSFRLNCLDSLLYGRATVRILEWLQHIFWVSEYLGNLGYPKIWCRFWSDCSIGSNLIRVYTVSPDMSVQKLRIIRVLKKLLTKDSQLSRTTLLLPAGVDSQAGVFSNIPFHDWRDNQVPVFLNLDPLIGLHRLPILSPNDLGVGFTPRWSAVKNDSLTSRCRCVHWFLAEIVS